jgi:hypothetical protein
MSAQSLVMVARDEGEHFHFLKHPLHRENQQRAVPWRHHGDGVLGPEELLGPPPQPAG